MNGVNVVGDISMFYILKNKNKNFIIKIIKIYFEIKKRRFD